MKISRRYTDKIQLIAQLDKKRKTSKNVKQFDR